MLRIMTSKPIVTNMRRANPSHPKTMAATPTPLLTLPIAKVCATCDAATDAVCCHRTETSTKMEATKTSAKATCETGRDGKYLTSISEPVFESLDSCQPGKVASMRKATKARMTATILDESARFRLGLHGRSLLHQVGKDDVILESVGDVYEIQWILVGAHLLGKQCCIIRAQERSAVRVDA